MSDYKYKTDPFEHQHERFILYRDRAAHAHLWEQRTGKSKIIIDTSAYHHSKGNIDGLLIIAPNGVHLNWVRNEIPTHMPEYTGCEAFAYESTPKAAERKELQRLMNTTSHGLRALSMNVEAIRSPKGFEFAMRFLQSYRALFAFDEGSTIKTFDASQTEAALKLSIHAPIKRLLNGTPVTQSPLDIFPQFQFLDPSILRTTSWYAFRNKYAILESQGAMKRTIISMLDKIALRLGSYSWGVPVLSEEGGIITAGQQHIEDGRDISFRLIPIKHRVTYQLRWSCETDNGSEMLSMQPGDVYTVITGYQKLDELQALIMPHSDRVLKADCLDLPEKVYQKLYIPLSKKQRDLYTELKKRSIAEVNGRAITASNALVKMLRLQQIIGGFYVPDNNIQLGLFDDCNADDVAERFDENCDAIPIEEHNPRIAGMLEDIERTSGKVLIWARFKAEHKAIADALRAKYGAQAVGEAHGRIKSDVRQQTIDAFRENEFPRYLVANPAAKGVSRGQDMHTATSEYYYSNSFSLEDRLQSEDRPHSFGQKANLGVIDLIAPDTLDEKTVQALRDKKELADMVTGDKLIEWI